MPGPFPQQEDQARTPRWLITAFVIYGTMIAGLLFFTIFPDAITRETPAERARAATLSKPVRYEAVIANWNRYRAKDARAELRQPEEEGWSEAALAFAMAPSLLMCGSD